MEFNGDNGDISPTIHCSRPEFQVFGKTTLVRNTVVTEAIFTPFVFFARY
jgi:hypothetical protein